MKKTDSVRRGFLLKGMAAGGLLAAGGFGYVLYKDQTWVASADYARVGTAAADSVVVVYSRSGNTLVAAKELARQLDADLFLLRAPQYPQSFAGQMKASGDARARRREGEILHPPIDFNRYRRVVLASPVWWYRPAVPMWAFVSGQDFAGREVLLMLTGNSGYERDYLDEFGAVVNASGGRFVDFHFIERGRVFWQLSSAQLRERAGQLAATHSWFSA